jgi:ornithine cyclodeaminase/alanine dehydrogenase-like protein (mu-crystallin family)
VALVLTYDDVRRCITMADAIGAIEAMCHEQASGAALHAERVNLRLPNGWMRLMPGALISSGVFGYKEFHLTHVAGSKPPAAEVRYAFHLFDYQTGVPLATMDANFMTAIRTGATSGVAMKYMTRPDSAVLGIIGSGSEARSHVQAAAAVRAIKKAVVFSRSAERREKFARDMEKMTAIEMKPTGRIEDTIKDADILIVGTNTGGVGPALLGEYLASRANQGLHVNSVGSTLPTQRELDPAVWTFADRIVVDSRRLLQESGDGIAATQAGAIKDSKVSELFEVVAGRAPGRSGPYESTLYKSIGTGLQDVAVASCIYRQALAKGLGQNMEPCQLAKVVEPN